jgi:beta-phosphoglucomutase family hydrolase
MVALNRDQYDAMILDLDGVITHTAVTHARSWKQAFDEFLEFWIAAGHAPFEVFDQQVDYLRYVDGKRRYDGVRSFLAARGIELPDGAPDDAPGFNTVCALGNRKNQIYNEFVDAGGVTVFDDAVERLRQWREQGLKTAVVSSSKNCRRILEVTGLEGLFDTRVDGTTASEMELEGKPSPAMFLEAAKRLAVAPARSAVIEDAYSGVEAGRRGGFGAVIGVARQEHQAAPLREAGADVVVSDLRELQLTAE